MKKSNKQQNIDKMIRYFKSNPQGCSSRQLADHLGCDMKTIQNYYDDLRANYVEGVELVKIKKGYYTIVDHRSPIDHAAIEIEKKVYLKLAVEVLEGLTDISRHHDEVVDDLKLRKVNTAYYVKPEEYEKLNTDKEEIELLEDAILEDAVIIFRYKGRDYHVEPYRLVNFDGIWYLYGKDKEEHTSSPYKTWMLEFIDDVEVDLQHKHTMPDALIDQHLEEADSALSVIGEAQFDVHLKVSAHVAEIFTRRNHFPDQKHTIQEDGSLLVTSTISSYFDIDPEIKSWFPHIEILEPREYRQEFLLQIEQYREKFKEEIEALCKTQE